MASCLLAVKVKKRITMNAASQLRFRRTSLCVCTKKDDVRKEGERIEHFGAAMCRISGYKEGFERGASRGTPRPASPGVPGSLGRHRCPTPQQPQQAILPACRRRSNGPQLPSRDRRSVRHVFLHHRDRSQIRNGQAHPQGRLRKRVCTWPEWQLAVPLPAFQPTRNSILTLCLRAASEIVATGKTSSMRQ